MAVEPSREFLDFILKTANIHLHVLKKVGAISNAQLWSELRQTRNALSHESPDDPGQMAKYFNCAYELAEYLLQCYEQIRLYVQRVEETKFQEGRRNITTIKAALLFMGVIVFRNITMVVCIYITLIFFMVFFWLSFPWPYIKWITCICFLGKERGY